MAEHVDYSGPSVSIGKKIGFAIVSLVIATAYFTYLDWALMNMQGLDYFYLFRK